VGKPLCTVLLWAWLIVCFFIHLHGSLCVEGLRVTQLDLVIAYGGWRKKKCVRILLGDDSGILGVCVKVLWGAYVDVLYLYLVLLYILGCCVLSSGWGVSSNRIHTTCPPPQHKPYL